MYVSFSKMITVSDIAIHVLTNACVVMVTYNFGNGFASAMRSYLTSLVPRDRIATLFTTIALFEGLSGFILPPLLGYAFSFGLVKGGLVVSLPFFIVASIYGLGFFAVCSIRHQRHGLSEY